MKLSPEIRRSFCKAGPRKTGGRRHGSSRILAGTPEERNPKRFHVQG
jgi:hypothetical protein